MEEILAHYRELNVNGVIYRYNIGVTKTSIGKVGVFDNSDIGTQLVLFDYPDHDKEEAVFYKTDTYIVTPYDVMCAINKTSYEDKRFPCFTHKEPVEHFKNKTFDCYEFNVNDKKVIVAACPKCQYNSFMRT